MSQIIGGRPVPCRTHVSSDHPPRRRDGSALPRCLRCCVGEPVTNPEPIVGVGEPVANPQPIVGVGEPQPVAFTDFAGPLSVADLDANPESHSDSYIEQQAITWAQPYSKPFAQFLVGTNAGSDTRADIAPHAFPGPGPRAEAAPGHRRILVAGNHPGSRPGGCSTHQ